MRKLILIRGVPGSGKSTLGQQLVNDSDDDAHLFEADDFFMEIDGEYRYDKSFVPEAHKLCQAQTAQMLFHGATVIVANTFTKYWELKYYFELAIKLSMFEIDIIQMTNEYGSIHGVPADKMASFRDRMESNEQIERHAAIDFPFLKLNCSEK